MCVGVYSHVCVHMWASVHICAHLHIWRPQEDARCPALSPSSLSLFCSYAGWPESSCNSVLLLRLQVCSLTLTEMHAGDLNSVPMPCEAHWVHELYPVSCLPRLAVEYLKASGKVEFFFPLSLPPHPSALNTVNKAFDRHMAPCLRRWTRFS